MSTDVSEVRAASIIMVRPRLWIAATNGHIVRPPDDSISMEIHSGLTLTGKNRRSRRKVCPSATLSTTNSTWTDPSVHDEWTATNRLNHGTAHENGLFWCV
jgi:hypothetical protein